MIHSFINISQHIVNLFSQFFAKFAATEWSVSALIALYLITRSKVISPEGHKTIRALLNNIKDLIIAYWITHPHKHKYKGNKPSKRLKHKRHNVPKTLTEDSTRADLVNNTPQTQPTNTIYSLNNTDESVAYVNCKNNIVKEGLKETNMHNKPN